jgi:hypothetical protein
MRHLIKIAALPLLPLVLGGHARAAENEGKVITLSCEGTLTRTYGADKPSNPEPLQKTGVIVNLDGQTVFFLGYVVPIESVDEASINFGARRDQQRILRSVGKSDRAANTNRILRRLLYLGKAHFDGSNRRHSAVSALRLSGRGSAQPR